MDHVPPDVFGEDYLYFYEGWLDDELSDAQAELLWEILGLAAGDEVLDVPCGHGRIANRLAANGAHALAPARRRLLVCRRCRPRRRPADARESADDRHRDSLSRVSSRFTCVSALPSRARFAASFSQPLAPEG